MFVLMLQIDPAGCDVGVASPLQSDVWLICCVGGRS